MQAKIRKAETFEGYELFAWLDRDDSLWPQGIPISQQKIRPTIGRFVKNSVDKMTTNWITQQREKIKESAH